MVFTPVQIYYICHGVDIVKVPPSYLRCTTVLTHPPFFAFSRLRRGISPKQEIKLKNPCLILEEPAKFPIKRSGTGLGRKRAKKGLLSKSFLWWSAWGI